MSSGSVRATHTPTHLPYQLLWFIDDPPGLHPRGRTMRYQGQSLFFSQKTFDQTLHKITLVLILLKRFLYHYYDLLLTLLNLELPALNELHFSYNWQSNKFS